MGDGSKGFSEETRRTSVRWTGMTVFILVALDLFIFLHYASDTRKCTLPVLAPEPAVDSQNAA
jgi:hypothetical protein